MENNIRNQICTLLESLGGSPFRFNNAMFNNYIAWSDMDINDVKYILDRTKYCGICQYALIPFFVKYIGVDLRPLCLKIGKKNKWDITKIEHSFASFPEKFTSIHSSSITDYPNYQVSRPYCLNIRKRLLLGEEVQAVEKLRISDKGEWLYFEEPL
jgi:hypothetical protein